MFVLSYGTVVTSESQSISRLWKHADHERTYHLFRRLSLQNKAHTLTNPISRPICIYVALVNTTCSIVECHLEPKLRQVTCIVRERQSRRICGAPPYRRLSDQYYPYPRGWTLPRGRSYRSYSRQMQDCLGGMCMTSPGFCLSNGQTKVEGVTSQCGCGDALTGHATLYLF